MSLPDLYALREQLTRDGTMLCFNGPISRSLLEEIGHALKNYLEAEHARPAAASDVFAVYIEVTQNIRHYANQRGYGDHHAVATVVITRHSDGRYVVSAGNCVEPEDGRGLMARVRELAAMDKAQLKTVYKEQLRKPLDPGSSGAGLGLIDIARKSSEPISASLRETADGKAFFSLSVVI